MTWLVALEVARSSFCSDILNFKQLPNNELKAYLGFFLAAAADAVWTSWLVQCSWTCLATLFQTSFLTECSRSAATDTILTSVNGRICVCVCTCMYGMCVLVCLAYRWSWCPWTQTCWEYSKNSSLNSHCLICCRVYWDVPIIPNLTVHAPPPSNLLLFPWQAYRLFLRLLAP